MALILDKLIKKLAKKGMIELFEKNQIKQYENKKLISYRLSSYRYGLRIGDEFRMFINVYNFITDHKNFKEDFFVEIKVSISIILTNSFILERSIGYFKIPRNILTICIEKFTYYRYEIIINLKPYKLKCKRYITLEISNITPLLAKVYTNKRLAQSLFFEAKEQCLISCANKKEKYMEQVNVKI